MRGRGPTPQAGRHELAGMKALSIDALNPGMPNQSPSTCLLQVGICGTIERTWWLHWMPRSRQLVRLSVGGGSGAFQPRGKSSRFFVHYDQKGMSLFNLERNVLRKSGTPMEPIMI